MSATSATAQGESYVYGGILFRRVSERERDEKPHRAGLLTCLSQGLTTGVILTFLFTVAGMLGRSNVERFSEIFNDLAPMLLFWSMAGFAEGLVIWIATRVAGHNLGWFKRLIIGASVFLVPAGVLLSLLSTGYYRTLPISEFIAVLGIAGGFGASFGLLTGSRFSPWLELVRANNSLPAGSWFLAGLTGLVLRIPVVLLSLMSIILFIDAMQHPYWYNNLAIGIVPLLYCGIALVIVFARLRFWLLLLLALVINIPVVLFLHPVLKGGLDLFAYICLGYLSAWALFLISRCPLTYRGLDLFKEEIKYYLID